MKTLPSGALRSLQSALPLLFFLGLLSSPVARAWSAEQDDADVFGLPLGTAAVPPSRTEAMGLLAGICGPEHVQAAKNGVLYCDQTPGYPIEDFVRCGLEIRGVLRGHFTSPQADEAIADDLWSCEAHAHDYGGSVLLRQEDGIWRRIAYFPGDRAARCLVFPRHDGRDALVCGRRSHTGPGEFAVDIELRSLEPGVEAKDLLDVHSNDGGGYCESFSAGQRQLHSRFKSWERRPATAGTPVRLVVQVETEDFLTPDFCGKRSANQTLDQRTGEALNDKFETFRAEQRRIEIVTFDWDGERFLLTSPLSSPALLSAQWGDPDGDDDAGDGDDSDVLMLTLKSETAQPSLTEARSLLAGICGPEHVQAEKKDGALYCDESPGYPVEESVHCGLDLRRGVLHGHFTSPRADEAVADYTGACEPHAHDYGGSILLRKQNGTWRRIAYFPGERAARCLVFPRRDGRDALVCASAFSGQGDYSANLELRSLKPGIEPEDLLDVHSKDGMDYCEHFSAGERQSHTRFKGWERLPAAKGTPARLAVQVETEDFVTPGFCGKPADNEDLDDATSDALNDKFETFRAQHRRIQTVTFDWNGERFAKKK